MTKYDVCYMILASAVIFSGAIALVLRTNNIISPEVGGVWGLCLVPVLILMAIITEILNKKYFENNLV